MMFSSARRLASAAIVKLRDWRRELGRQFYFPVSIIPGELGWLLRRGVLSRIAAVGRGAMIDELVRIDVPEKLAIGERTFVGRGSFIHAGGGVRIGNDVLIGPGVKIWSADHRFAGRTIPISRQGHEFAEVIIEDDVWIGVDSIVLKGVRIATGAVVAAGSVVTKDVAPYSVVAGVPARLVRVR